MGKIKNGYVHISNRIMVWTGKRSTVLYSTYSVVCVHEVQDAIN